MPCGEDQEESLAHAEGHLMLMEKIQDILYISGFRFALWLLNSAIESNKFSHKNKFTACVHVLQRH